MSNGGLFAVHGEDTVHHLGVIFSTGEITLRMFNAAYMRDPGTIGSPALRDPNGQTVATFDVWTGDWKEVADDVA